MADYKNDRHWSDITIPQVKAIVGPLLLENAAFELDAKQATDLIVLKAKDMRIAARVRRPGYFERYPYEFTIRAHRDSGAETEMSKIVNGFGDWMFYGHANEANKIHSWFVIDLHAFRAALIRRERHAIKMETKDNGDGTRFVAFDVRSFPETPPILVSSSETSRRIAA